MSENKQIWGFRDHIDFKQPRNYKFDFDWAWTKSTQSHFNQPVDFFSGHSLKNHTNSENSQNLQYIGVIQVYILFIQSKLWPIKVGDNLPRRPCTCFWEFNYCYYMCILLILANYEWIKKANQYGKKLRSTNKAKNICKKYI